MDPVLFLFCSTWFRLMLFIRRILLHFFVLNDKIFGKLFITHTYIPKKYSRSSSSSSGNRNRSINREVAKKCFSKPLKWYRNLLHSQMLFNWNKNKTVFPFNFNSFRWEDVGGSGWWMRKYCIQYRLIHKWFSEWSPYHSFIYSLLCFILVSCYIIVYCVMRASTQNSTNKRSAVCVCACIWFISFQRIFSTEIWMDERRHNS